ncbi:MAG TPA: OsmC family protein [Thermoanaerobaculia bacterium]|nr:OsmC family protein [Thermoanaerobaculia bacterium]
MATRKADAVWTGGLKNGKGTMRLGSGAFEGKYSFSTRFEEEPGTNPEELIGAAHAGCFSMALSGVLGKAGLEPKEIRTKAKVHLEKVGEGFGITRIELETRASVPGVDEATFHKHAEAAKTNCPVSKALGGVKIDLDAKLA